jgi:hypothetical protein
MSKKTLMIFYRTICKDIKLQNVNLYRSYIEEEITKAKIIEVNELFIIIIIIIIFI